MKKTLLLLLAVLFVLSGCRGRAYNDPNQTSKVTSASYWPIQDCEKLTYWDGYYEISFDRNEATKKNIFIALDEIQSKYLAPDNIQIIQTRSSRDNFIFVITIGDRGDKTPEAIAIRKKRAIELEEKFKPLAGIRINCKTTPTGAATDTN